MIAKAIAARLADARVRLSEAQAEVRVWCAVVKELEPLLTLAEQGAATGVEPPRIPLSGANFPISSGERRNIQALCLEQIHFAPGRMARAIADSIGRVREADARKALLHLKDKGVALMADDDTWWPVETPSAGSDVEAPGTSATLRTMSDTGEPDSANTRASPLAKTPVLKKGKPPMTRAALLDFIRRGGDMGVGESQLTIANAQEADIDALVDDGLIAYDESDRRYRLTTKPEVTE